MTGYHSGGDWLAMVLMMVAFWGLLVALVVWAIRSARPGGETPSPERVLAARFARGEIDDDEFRRRRGVLVGAGQAEES